MDDLINRQAAIDALDEPCKVTETWTDEYAVGERIQWEKDVKALNSLPSAEQQRTKDILKASISSEDLFPDLPQEIKDKNTEIARAYQEGYKQGKKDAERHGRWIMHIDDLFPAESTMECDQCHEEQPLECDDKYCQNCGAKMERSKE